MISSCLTEQVYVCIIILGISVFLPSYCTVITGVDPGFQVRGGTLKKIAPSGGRCENFWGISCEK